MTSAAALTTAIGAPIETITCDGPCGWSNAFLELGDRYFTRLAPTPMPHPHWVATSDACAGWLGFPDDWATRSDWNSLQVLSGNATWRGSAPLASVYSGHQFGVWAGQLGDGRALWLGGLDTPHGALELQLKGAGMTPYSRMGDGRAVLRSSIREFLCSEAMHALGIPTTRALCITGSTLPVRRESVETAAVVTRAAESFIRFGHVEHFGNNGDLRALRALADFVIDHHVPTCRGEAQPYAALLQHVINVTAGLIAQWQAVGFCHGVMNTDNMSILGLTIDYGPFGFLDGFDPMHIVNHSDSGGRYVWARQPQVGGWNLRALAQGLLPLLDDSEQAVRALESYGPRFSTQLLARFRAKLGLVDAIDTIDQPLIDDLLRLMAGSRADFTITFRRLCDFDAAAGARNDALRDLFIDRDAFDAWATRYGERLRAEKAPPAQSLPRRDRMRGVNPAVVLRNHLAETAIRAARVGDFGAVHRLHAALQRPFDEPPPSTRYAELPPEWASDLEVSCSS